MIIVFRNRRTRIKKAGTSVTGRFRKNIQGDTDLMSLMPRQGISSFGKEKRRGIAVLC